MSFISVPAAGQSPAFAGLAADTSFGDVVSGFSEESTAQIAFGTGVQFGVATRGVKNLTSSGVLNGVAEFSFAHSPGTPGGDLGGTGLNPNASIRVKRRGRIYVALDPSVTSLTPGTDRGFCRYSANGGNAQIGAFSNVSDAGNNLDCTKQVVFVSNVMTAPDGGKIAIVDVDFINKP